MNGDGRDDLIGSWPEQGVYYRNSDTGDWIKLGKPASKIATGDLDYDSIDDLIGIWPSQEGVWIKYSKSGNWGLLSSTADWIGAGDMNGDGRDDFLGTWIGQGVYYKNSASGTWHKIASPAVKITSGDLDDDGIDDLIGIWPAQGGVWIKSSRSGLWEWISTTADWIDSGDMNGDGKEFRWTREYGGMTIKIEKPVIEIPLHASHPDIKKNPVEVEVYIIKAFFKTKRLLGAVQLSTNEWKSFKYPIPDEVGKELILLFKVSRTWNPMEVMGTPDPRNLGVAVGRIEFIK
jgi:hypothetical protein